MKVITWNCRGLGSVQRQRGVMDLCRQTKPDVLCLVETRSSSDFTSQLSLKLGFDRDVRIPSEGFAGGIWVFWNNSSSTITVLEQNRQFVHLAVEDPCAGRWVITLAYVRPNRTHKA